MATKKKSIIKMPHGGVRQLADTFHVSVACVYNALSYNTASVLAENIRRQALELGGKIGKKIVFQ